MDVLGHLANDKDESPGLLSERTAPLWPSLLLCVLLATLINLGNSHRTLNSDDLVPVLSSLYAWTPFFWEQLRLGMLISLLATPFENPLVNLLVQSEISFIACLFVFFLIARYLQRGPYWPLTGAAVVLVHLLAAAPPYLRMYWTPAQAYGPSLCLAMLGLILLEGFPGWKQAPGRLIGALVLMLLAHWGNSSVAILIAPLVLLRYVFSQQVSLRECLAGLILSCGAFVGIMAFSLVLRKYEIQLENPLFPFTFSPLAEWPSKWKTVCTSLSLKGGMLAPAIVGVTVLSKAAAAATTAGRTALRGLVPRLVPVTMACIFYLAVFCAMEWSSAKDTWLCRYAMPPICLGTVAIASVCWAPWWPRLVRNRSPFSVAGCTSLLLVTATLALSGRPSLTKVRRDIDNACGGLTEELRAAGCTHIDGDFWKVWPAMFHANLVAYERGDSKQMWGLAYRATALQKRWRDVPAGNVKLAILNDNANDPHWHQFYPFKLSEMTRQQHGKFETAVPPDLFLVWARGFYGEEGTGDHTFRWARRNAELWVCNRTSTDQPVRLQMQMLRDGGGSARLKISSDWFQEEVQVSTGETSLDRTFALPSGWHTIKFACDGSRIPSETDIGRWLAFRVLNARVSPLPASTNTPSSSPNASTASSSGDLASRPVTPTRQ